MNNKTLKIIHITSWLLLLAQIMLFIATGLTLRADWPNLLITIVMLLSGLMLFFTHYKKVPAVVKICYWFFPVYIVCLFISFAMERILFIVLVGPFWLAVMTQETYLTNGSYSLKSNKTILGSFQAELYRNHFLILEKEIGSIPSLEHNDIRTWRNLQVQDSAGVEKTITLYKDGHNTMFTITKR